MWGRPFCVAALVLVAIIFLFRLICGDEVPQKVKKNVGITGQVEEIGSGGTSIVVRDVSMDGKYFKVKIYSSSRKAENGISFSELKIGQVVSFDGTLQSFSMPGNPGQFNEYKYYKELGIDFCYFAKACQVKNDTVNILEQGLYNLRHTLCEGLERSLPPQEAGTMAAMVFGEKSNLDTEIKDLYKQNGIAHILAISGLHISLIGVGLFNFLRSHIMPMRCSAGVTVCFLILYGTLTGFPVSTRRAVFMMICMLGARFIGRKYDRLSALSLSAIIELMFSPELLFQSGFLLSYGTVLGITVFMEQFRFLYDEKKSKKAVHKIAAAILGSFGIQLVTFPVLLYNYYEWNPYSIIVNVCVLPFTGILIMFTIIGCICSCFFLVPAKFIMGPVYYILFYYNKICKATEYLPANNIIQGQPSWWQIAGYYFFLIIFCRLMWYCKNRPEKISKYFLKKYKLSSFLIIVSLCILLIPVNRPHHLIITNLDVGQGDCCCITVDGKTILIDGGSSDVSQVGKYRIAPYLKYRGIQKIDYIFVTHSDSDHTSGIEEIMEDSNYMGFTIGAIVLPDIKKKDDNYRKLENKIKDSNIALKKIKSGNCLKVGNAKFECIHPDSDYDWQSENDYSTVLRLSYVDFSGIFTGDLEEEGEREILSSNILSDTENVDYLKVGHHGSKTSSSEEFIQRLKPTISIISVGEKNTYGHPTPETLNRLSQVESRIFCTDECGALQIEVDEKICVKSLMRT